jgi:hypothetical protein
VVEVRKRKQWMLVQRRWGGTVLFLLRDFGFEIQGLLFGSRKVLVMILYVMMMI